MNRPKFELKPKNTSVTVSKLQQRIKLLSNYSANSKKVKTGTSFYSPLQQALSSQGKNSKIEPILMSKKKYEQQVQRAKSEQHKGKFKPLFTEKTQRQGINDSKSSAYKSKDQKSEIDTQKKMNILKPIIVYQQEQDKAITMQQKLRLLYLGSRLTHRNWHKSFYNNNTNQHSQRKNFF